MPLCGVCRCGARGHRTAVPRLPQEEGGEGEETGDEEQQEQRGAGEGGAPEDA